MSPFSLSDLQVFFGKLTENSASIYAKLPATASTEWSDRMRLTGEVTGPICEGTRTLPATVPLQFVGADPTPLASASIPDPSFWSAAVPARYEVTVRIEDGQTTHLEGRRRLGLRRLGPQNRSLTDQGRRMVVRGVADDYGLDQHGAEDWYEQRLHFLQALGDRTDAIQFAQQLDMAERAGFPLVACVATTDEASLRQQMRLCSNCAAVSLMIIEPSVVSSAGAVVADCTRELPNLRLAAARFAKEQTPQPEWSLATVIRVDEAGPAELCLDDDPRPVLLRRRPAAIPRELAAKRQLCEQLQREFTVAGDFAGYLIG